MSRLAVVVPLEPGSLERVRTLVGAGPPFDLEATGVDRHEVFLTEREAIFVFDSPEATPLELPGEDPALWEAAASWREHLAERPRVARLAYSWSRSGEADGVSFDPTPGPGDSEGGDLYVP